MSFTWFDLIVIFGILQGIVCSVLIQRKKPVPISHWLLISVLLVFSLLSFKIELHTLRLWDDPAFRYFPLAVDLLIQPLLYLYVIALIRPERLLWRNYWFHFLPPILFFVHAMITYLAVLPTETLSLKDHVAEQWHYNAVKTIEDYLSVISAMFYGYLGVKNVIRYRKWVHEHISATNYLTFTWLRNLGLATGILGIGLFVNILLDNVFRPNRDFTHWQLFYVYLSGVIYYLGFKGYLSAREVVIPRQEAPLNNDAPVLKVKYSTEELADATQAIQKALVESRVFLNSELTLHVLAKHIGLGDALVSATINKEFGKSFRTLVNDYRVEEVKLKLADAAYAHLSILGIALECGFNSEASFYRIFKAATGIAPKEFMKGGK